MYCIRVPSLAENIEVATIATWLAGEGDKITPGMELVELITEKAEFTLEAEEEVSGTLLACLATEKSTLPVGYILCVVGSEYERREIDSARKENAERLEQGSGTLVSLNTLSTESFPKKTSSVRAAPAARRLAKELGLDLAEIASELGLERTLKEIDVSNYQQMKQKGIT